MFLNQAIICENFIFFYQNEFLYLQLMYHVYKAFSFTIKKKKKKKMKLTNNKLAVLNNAKKIVFCISVSVSLNHNQCKLSIIDSTEKLLF